MGKQISQQMGIDARVLYDVMDKLEVGGTLSYEDLSTAICRDIKSHRASLYTAIKNHQKSSKIFAVKPKEGIKRVDDSTAINMASSNLGRIRNITRKSSRLLSAISDFDALPNDMKIRHNATMSLCGAILECSKSKSLKAVEERLVTNNAVLPIAETLRMFSL